MAADSTFQKKLEGILEVVSDVELKRMFSDFFSDPEALDIISKYLSLRSAAALVAGSKGKSGEQERINLLFDAVSNFSDFVTEMLSDALKLADVGSKSASEELNNG